MIRAIWEFPERIIGQQVIVYRETDSTNSRAMEHAGREGLAFLADEQTAGRGTQGRRWTAAPGASVLLSVLLHPPESLRRAVILTAWAAVSVGDTLSHWRVRSRIKWPNDVLVGGRKIAGILTEIRGEAVVVGIGLNVRQTASDWAEAGLSTATSLAVAGVHEPTEAVAQVLLGCLNSRYRALQTNGEELESAWREALKLQGRRVRIRHVGGETEGTVRELSWQTVCLEEGGGWRPEEIRLELAEEREEDLPFEEERL
jgi:BirA family biotin operon repressor/biotin-[acetyl-CoA-carboxylase] ligase